ncbi:DUF4011 domain-containing protein [Actinomyces mediterranea]|uniref:DUF4011 domain-containing protein n=1 Tax=Actinomyces mediterranea TaxID=1871028 RepID=UPI00196814C6|nr:DUF4011 domain-containing protein [Actinomyces mediterranea]
MAVNEQVINGVVLQILPRYLGPYVRRRLAEEHPDVAWESPVRRRPGEAPMLDDLSEQIFALTGKDRHGDPILSTDIEFRSRLHAIRKARNKYAHQQRFEVHEVLTVLGQVIDILREIGAPEGAADVNTVLKQFMAHQVPTVLTEDTTEINSTTSSNPGDETALSRTTDEGAGHHSPDENVAEPTGIIESPDVTSVRCCGDVEAAERALPGSISMEPGKGLSDVSTSDTAETSVRKTPEIRAIDALRVEFNHPEVFSYAHAVARLKPRIDVNIFTVAEDYVEDDDGLPGSQTAESQEQMEGVTACPAPVLRGVQVTVSVEDDGEPLIKPYSFALETVNGNRTTVMFEPEFEDRTLLQAVSESNSTIIVRFECDGQFTTVPLKGPKVLSPHQWMRTSDETYAASALATFVQPQHPEIARLVKEASIILTEEIGSGSLEGYQGGSQRVDEIVYALCRAFYDRHIAYTVPANNWAEIGQRIRNAEAVLDGGLATCLDSTLVLASALESLKIEPLVIVLDGHSLLGYWKTPKHNSEEVAMPGWTIINPIARGEIGLVETTLLTSEALPLLRVLHTTGRRSLGEDGTHARFVLSIREARERGIPPQKTRTRNIDGSIVENTAPVIVRENTLTLENSHGSLPGSGPRKERAPERVEKWKSDLLDLSVRNRLINCSERALESHKIIELAVPETLIGAFEDLINSGKIITLVAAGERAADARRLGNAFHQELEPPKLAPRLSDHREVQIDLSAEVYDPIMRRLRSSARTLIDETGANNLYLALGTLVWGTKGKELRSPLVFIPVELEHVSKNSPYRLRVDPTGGTTPNYSLIERLRVDLGLELPELAEPIEDESGIDLPRLFDVVRKTLSDNRLPFRIEPTTYLGIFQFGSFRLWKDLDESWNLLARNPLVRHLIEAPGEIFEDPAEQSRVPDLEQVLPTLPIPADASQTEVVAHTIAGRTLVVEGPPGTGKSQTITNLIIRAISDGKKVMFVAEKRAALDVVARRLKAAGVGDLVLNLHDRKQKPDDVRRTLLAAADIDVHPNSTGLDVHRRLADSALSTLERYRKALHSPSSSGLTVYSAYSTLLAYGDSSDELPIPGEALIRTDSSAVDQLKSSALQTLYKCFLEYREGAGDAYTFLQRPVPPDETDALFGVIERAQHLRSLEFDPEIIGAISRLSQSDLEKILSVLDSTEIDPHSLRIVQTPEWMNAAAQLDETLRYCETMPNDTLVYFYTSVFSADLMTIRHEVIDSKNAWFGKLKKIEKALSPLAVHRTSIPLPSDPGVVLALVDSLIQLQHTHLFALERLRETLPSYAARLQHRWSPFDLACRQEALDAIRWLRSVTDLVPSPGDEANELQELAGKLFDMPHRSTVSTRVRECLQTVMSVASTRVLEGIPLYEIINAPRASDYEQERRDDLVARLALLDAVEPFRRLGFDEAADVLLSRRIPTEDLETALEKGVARATVDGGLASGPLHSFSADTHVKLSTNYSQELGKVRSLLPDLVVQKAVDQRSFSDPISRNSRFFLLKSDLERKRKKKPIRDLISDYGDLITELTPCVLVSPDSVARFFPPERQDFDLVVFDEASQITVASAIGAMGRGRAIVVCGDSKQMPPTSFAELTRDDEDDDRPVDEESILSECVAAHVPRKWLMWHYRSQDESLIAFSNTRYYQGKLFSFPSPISGTVNHAPEGFGVSMRRVNGHFLRSIPRGESRRLFRTNPVEAQAIVDEIRHRFDRRPAPSLGVVTFNIQQRDLIEHKLRELDDPNITASLESDDGIFVKNLENVQGDERDTILFSIAFSADQNGEVPLNFGPLNRSGGERRLNVAITRARKEVILFSSFAPSALHAERSQSLGLNDLKSYLELADKGASSPDQARPLQDLPDHHRDAIAKALRDAGLVVSTDVGLSEFRLDLVLAKPSSPDRPSVAVMLDGSGWNLRKTTYDRDVLPGEILRSNMHWPHVERIWLPDWLSDRERIIHHLVELTLTTEVGEAEPSDTAKTLAAVHNESSRATVSDLMTVNPPSDNRLIKNFEQDASSDPEECGGSDCSETSSKPSSMRSAQKDNVTVLTPDTDNRVNNSSVSGESLRDFSIFPSRRSLHSHNRELHRVVYRDLSKPVNFIPANVGIRGTQVYLDMTEHSGEICAHVKETARMICAQEFPIEGRRFRYLVARAYGFERMKASREERIKKIIGTEDYIVDEFGFFWPNDVDPAALISFRRNAFDHVSLEEMHPRELDNLTRTVLRSRVFASHEEKIRTIFNNLGESNHRLTPRLQNALQESVQRVERNRY